MVTGRGNRPRPVTEGEGQAGVPDDNGSTSPRHRLEVPPGQRPRRVLLPQGQATAGDHSWWGGAVQAEEESKNKFQIRPNFAIKKKTAAPHIK